MKQIHIIFAILFAINCNTITKVQLDSNNNNNNDYYYGKKCY